MKTPIQLIAIDLDGTLLNSQLTITPRTARAIRRAMEAGIPATIATGRPYLTSARYVRELGLTAPGVFLQGLAIHNADGSIRHEQVMEPETARRILAYAQEHRRTALAYNSGSIYARERNAMTDTLFRYNEPVPEIVAALSDLPDRVPVSKVVFLLDPSEIPALRADLSQIVNGTASLFTSQAHMLECIPPGTSKGAGLARLLQDEGIDPARVLAIGDGENDIEMLQLAGISVAMGNAKDHIKAAAQHVTATNDEDGVAEAVERFALG